MPKSKKEVEVEEQANSILDGLKDELWDYENQVADLKDELEQMEVQIDNYKEIIKSLAELL